MSRTNSKFMETKEKDIFLGVSFNQPLIHLNTSKYSQSSCRTQTKAFIMHMYFTHYSRMYVDPMTSYYKVLGGSPSVLSMWPYKLKLDEKKSKHTGLVQQNGFGTTFLQSLLRVVKGTCQLTWWCRAWWSPILFNFYDPQQPLHSRCLDCA
jgi:hypothetical protein